MQSLCRREVSLRSGYQVHVGGFRAAVGAGRDTDDEPVMPKISPLAAVDPGAQIAPDAEVGQFCVVGPDVRIGPGGRLVAHVTVMGRTTIGSDNVFYPNSVIGAPP